MKASQDFVAADFGKVAVLYGGINAERRVSLDSGAAVLAACQQLGLDVVGLDIGDSPIEQIQSSGVDWAFNVLHGGIGENGGISSILDALGIAYCSSDSVSSAVSFNKVFSKSVWQAAGLRVPACVLIDRSTSNPLEQVEQADLQLPLVVKPPCEGSSVGVSIVGDVKELASVLQRDLPQFGQLIVESYVQGNDYTVAILGDCTLPVIGIYTQEAFYDYAAKYISEETQMRIPSGLSQQQEQQLSAMAIKAFSLLGCSVWGRVDAICDQQGVPWLLEVNTIPGMTSHSLVPRAAQEIGLDFCQLVARIFVIAKNRSTHRESES